jgi:phosphoglycerate dehydrogenase-like enzyme
MSEEDESSARFPPEINSMTNHLLVDMPLNDKYVEHLHANPLIELSIVEPSESARPLPSPLAKKTEILFVSSLPTNITEMESLRLIQIASSDYSELCGLGLPERKVRACNGLGNFDVPIAEWNMAMMVNLARDLRSMIRNQDEGLWDRSARFQREIRGSTVGIWGYGGIGRETARLAKSWGMKIHVMSRQGVAPRLNTYRVPGTGDPEGKLPDKVFTSGQEESFLKELDFLILSMPLTNKTRGIVGERELRYLPRSAFILNPGRGPLIDEAALISALHEGWIAGAALDTHYHYPLPPEHPLWRIPNVIMTPHISGSSSSPHFLDRIWDIFTQNVERYISGEQLLNELTPSQLNEN